MHLSRRCKSWLICILAIICFVAVFGWYKFLRQVPQAAFANEGERFKYGSIGAENAKGIPYWIWLVLPQVFPDLMPGPGGYKSFGVVWEPGQEIPVGFSKMTIGFPRIANNCAICHVGTWRANEVDLPHVVVGAPAATSNLQSMMRFLTNCAADPRFNADTLLAQIEKQTKLSMVDRLIYRFALIPLTRSALQKEATQLAWMNRPDWPAWGTGRDDPMNLTKYFMTTMPVDNTVGQSDFPSVWNLKIRKGDGLFLNWSCDTPAVRSVLIDSALGLGAAPDPTVPLDTLNWKLERRAWFIVRMAELDEFLSDLAPPAYPFPVDSALAAQGKQVYAQSCASCHEPGQPHTSRLIAIADIGTDRNRMDTWNQAAADQANEAVAKIGIIRPGLVKQVGYQSPPLDGLWMRAPYLHNGSVPNLRSLLAPVSDRPAAFFRGYDIYDPADVGFVTAGAAAEREGWKEDTTVRGNGNQGHTYGTDLSATDKTALLEYLKTL
jgi:mono/diheme cytochrome c family protein